MMTVTSISPKNKDKLNLKGLQDAVLKSED
jgi:hypothetical protein